jgi:hypothetical protein
MITTVYFGEIVKVVEAVQFAEVVEIVKILEVVNSAHKSWLPTHRDKTPE